jgi:putative phosphoesterase
LDKSILKIGVISDTHWNSLSQAYTGARKLLNSVFADVDAIIHAGDMQHPDVDLAFASHPFHAVQGNMDISSSHTPLKRMLKLGGVHIGVIHGWGQGAEIEANAAAEFDLQNTDVLIYGHSHYPACHVENRVLFFNPGSATDRRRAPCHSVGLIYISHSDADSNTEIRDKCERDANDNSEMQVLKNKTCPIVARQMLQCASNYRVRAEIINIDAIA